MTNLLHNLLVCTVSGSIMFALGTLLNLKISKRSMSQWYYGIIIMSLIMMIFPFERIIDFPRLVRINIPTENVIIQASGMLPFASDNIAAPKISVISIVFCIWFSISFILWIRNIILYLKTANLFNSICTECCDIVTLNVCESMKKRLKIRKNVKVMVSREVSSPLLFGIFRTKIIIPDRKFSDKHLRMIFAHELTHLKHFDLHIKLLGIAVGCIHWFNPIVYMMRRSLNTICEWCCDESVLYTLNLDDKKDYGRLIISVIEESGNDTAAYCTSMASANKYIKKRLSRIAGFKEVTKFLRTTGVMLAAVLSVCSLTAFGFTQAAAILPEEIAPVFENPAPKPVSRPFSAKPRPTEFPAEPTQEPVLFTAVNDDTDNYIVYNTNDSQYQPEEFQDNTVSEYTEEVSEAEINNTSAMVNPINYNDVPSVTVIPSPEPKTEQEAVPQNTPFTLQTIQIPNKSAYVFNIVYEEDGTVSTPVLEAIKSTKVCITAINLISEINVYRCDINGNIYECIYRRDKDIYYSINMDITAGEYYIITVANASPEAKTNKLIIE